MTRRATPWFCILAAALAALLASASPGVAQGLSSTDDEDEEVEVRERSVGKNYPLEKELQTDRSDEPWLYVLSAIMLLGVGWLCFKPTRVYKGKKDKPKKKKKDKKKK